MRHDQECPACGIRLVVVGEDILTLDDALADEMEGRIDRERAHQEWEPWAIGLLQDREWERLVEDEAPER